METKKCNKCLEIKSVDHFQKDKGMKDGHKNYCKKCYKEKIYSYGEKKEKKKEILILKKVQEEMVSHQNQLLLKIILRVKNAPVVENGMP